ncbi:hypothetical protein GJ744_000909 [Endocarpon pusillum]|uniref:Uncharacterized protein n=1 Tax=Endocarpon pusillum TaxID=364733 RepID=A0A8H7AP21_9EURO|nr:hypothetical protein GJ744_000909 [Endocarpon pusillum]
MVCIVTGGASIIVGAPVLGDLDAVIDRPLGLRRAWLAGVVVAAWDFACEVRNRGAFGEPLGVRQENVLG